MLSLYVWLPGPMSLLGGSAYRKGFCLQGFAYRGGWADPLSPHPHEPEKWVVRILRECFIVVLYRL